MLSTEWKGPTNAAPVYGFGKIGLYSTKLDRCRTDIDRCPYDKSRQRRGPPRGRTRRCSEQVGFTPGA